MKKFFAMAAIALFTLASCSSDDATPVTNNPGENPVDAVLVKKVITTSQTLGTTTEIYNYDAQNRVTNTTDENGVVTSEFTYDGNKIIKVESLDTDGTVIVRNTFEYDASGRLSLYKVTTYGLPEGFPNTLKKVFTYNQDGTIASAAFYGDETEQTDSDGISVLTMSNDNIIQAVETPASGTGSSTRTFTFDNKNNPFKNIVGYNVITLATEGGGVNNITFHDYPNGDMYDTTFTYTYNADNYPLTSSSSSPGGIEATTIQYFYE